MSFIDREGVRIFYDVAGSGPAILLTHGYSATGDMWAGQVAELSRDHTLITWDMRGHGRSDYPADPGAYSEAQTVADIAAILDEVGVTEAVIGGLSLGGYMSLAVHLAHPKRTRALLIIDTGPGYRKDEAREGWNRNAVATAERYQRDGLGSLARGSVEMRTARHRDATGLALAARGMLTQKDDRVIGSLPTIGVPAIVVVGADDTPFLAASDYMAAKIPGAVKAVIPDAGHAANIDQPAAFNAAIRGFLDANGL
ncbi:MAG TPA: alpha/beta fold hydrolase [Caulobacteraceae bacterium]|nr:alpha/beta fold hydrolase [Caulobacteraceae bacterium]